MVKEKSTKNKATKTSKPSKTKPTPSKTNNQVNKPAKSAKGSYHYIKQAWKKPDKAVQRDRMIEWRKQERVTKINKPLRLDKARSLGYKAKKGVIMARVTIKRGGRKRPKPNKGRKTTKQTNKLVLKMNYRWVAEQRAAKKYKNLEVLNSYNIGKDGKYYFYEVILIDPSKPEIKNDKDYAWILNKTNSKRAQRGLTSAAKKSRGLRKKSRDLKVRPSQRKNKRKGK